MADPRQIYAFERFLDELKLYIKLKTESESPATKLWPGRNEINFVKTVKVYDELYNKSENLMAISDTIANHVKLDENETFCCFLFVTKRPEYLSEVMGPTPEVSCQMQEPALNSLDPTPEPGIRMLDSGSYNFPFGEIIAAACPFICYNKIMEPVIMKAMINKREEDKIDYSSKKS